jgi:hypothetical protein
MKPTSGSSLAVFGSSVRRGCVRCGVGAGVGCCDCAVVPDVAVAAGAFAPDVPVAPVVALLGAGDVVASAAVGSWGCGAGVSG